MAITNLLTQRIKVRRPQYTKDTAGGQSSNRCDDSILFKSVPASVQPADPTEMLAFAKQNIRITDKIFVAQELNLKNGDIIEWNGQEFKFTGNLNAVAQNRVWEIFVERFSS